MSTVYIDLHVIQFDLQQQNTPTCEYSACAFCLMCVYVYITMHVVLHAQELSQMLSVLYVRATIGDGLSTL